MVKRMDVVKKTGTLGAVAGIGLYAVFGLMQGAAIGGAAGLGLAKYLFGSGTLAIMANDLIPRMVVAGSMLAGVVVSLIMFVTFGTIAGAIGGLVLSYMAGPAVIEAEVSGTEGEFATESVSAD
jgi:hypothetical protein